MSAVCELGVEQAFHAMILEGTFCHRDGLYYIQPMKMDGYLSYL